MKGLVVLVLLSLAMNSQAQSFFNFKITDKKGKGVEGVYVNFSDGRFAFSDEKGKVDSVPMLYNEEDSLTLSHLNFKNIRCSIKEIIYKKGVVLEDDIKQLEEVVIYSTSSNYEDFLKEAIKKIAQNYENPFSWKSLYETDFLFAAKNKDLITYKGGLIFTVDRKKTLYVSKVDYEENINPEWVNYVFDKKPYSFTSIVNILSHPVIYAYEKFKFYNYKEIVYKGRDAIQVAFKKKKEKFGQEGTLIIDKEDRAFVRLSYEIYPVKNLVVEKTKRGIVKTSLEKYYIESDYEKTERGKYNFNSGRERIVLSLLVKKKVYETLNETYLKRKDNLEKPKARIPKEQIFEK